MVMQIVLSQARVTGSSGPLLVLGFGVLFVVWYVAGNELMRRRARRLATWCREATRPMGGTLAIRWLTNGCFQLEIRSPRPPFRSGTLTGLVESLDVVTVWLWNRWRGRRDMVQLQVVLDGRPIWGLELYRPRSLLAGDARHRAREERWQEQPLDDFRLASAGGAAPQELARRLLAALSGERENVVRLALRRQGAHLTLALNVPDADRLAPAAFYQLARDLAQITLSFSTPAG